MRTKIVVLGAGFGGLELITGLVESIPDLVDITLIDKSESFTFGFSKLDVMFGRRQLDQVRSPYRDIHKANVDVRQEAIRSIDPTNRRVVTDGGTYECDVLVVALGADYDFDATPGLTEGGFEFYSLEGAARAAQALADFEGGAVLVSVLGPFYKCPGAPIETVLLLDDFLKTRGLRDRSSIHLTSPLPMPIPISQMTSSALLALLEQAGVDCSFSTLVTHLDPAKRTAHLNDGGELPYDLFLGIPVHCAPEVVRGSDLIEDGWIPVDNGTFETRFPGVFAVGDVTSAPVPRAGGMAEREAATVADVLIARLTRSAAPPPFDGAAQCYVETGGNSVARIDVNFLSYDVPVAKFNAPTQQIVAEKQAWGATRLTRWFGYDDPDGQR
jgi:sulfide:quinone oxidoreductase